MKLQDHVRATKSRKMIMILKEIQFRKLAQNILNEQVKKTIKNTHLIKVK